MSDITATDLAASNQPAALATGGPAPPPDSAAPPKEPTCPEEFWNSLINEKVAANYLGLTDRTMQALRQRGGGARYIVISSRCVRYRRIDLKAWADARMRSSTSDPGSVAA